MAIIAVNFVCNILSIAYFIIIDWAIYQYKLCSIFFFGRRANLIFIFTNLNMLFYLFIYTLCYKGEIKIEILSLSSRFMLCIQAICVSFYVLRTIVEA